MRRKGNLVGNEQSRRDKVEGFYIKPAPDQGQDIENNGDQRDQEEKPAPEYLLRDKWEYGNYPSGKSCGKKMERRVSLDDR